MNDVVTIKRKIVTTGADGTATWETVGTVKCSFKIINSIEFARESRGYIYALITIRDIPNATPICRFERRGEKWDMLGAPVKKGRFLEIRAQRQVAM